MSTLGQKWSQEVEASGRKDAQEKTKQNDEEQKRQANEVIRAIPGLIQQAGTRGESFVSVLRDHFINFHDVAGSRKNKVDELYERLQKEGRSLRASDLAGRALIILLWCEEQGLECFLGPQKEMYDMEYRLCVRSKSSI